MTCLPAYNWLVDLVNAKEKGTVMETELEAMSKLCTGALYEFKRLHHRDPKPCDDLYETRLAWFLQRQRDRVKSRKTDKQRLNDTYSKRS